MNDLVFNISPTELAEKDYFKFKEIWEKYNLEIIGHFHQSYPDSSKSELETNGFFLGALTNEEVISFKKNIDKRRQDVKFINDADFNFHYTNFKEIGLEDDYNRDKV